MCSGLLVKKDLILFPLELKLCSTLVSRYGVCWGLVLVLRHTCPRKAAPVEHGGGGDGLDLSSLGSAVGAVLLREVSSC